ncbi:MAG: NADH-quinone oxidoreductase subunit N, partial [Ktedonobacteraceae bacterium]
YLKRLNLVHQGEYYALFLLATIGMMLMASATSFLTVFLGLELLSLALYILCSFVARRKGSQESGMKYFLLSSFASAFLLYGIALTYGATGGTAFDSVRTFLAYKALPSATQHSPTLLLIAMGLLTVGFAFKVSAIPFQAWTPDVYDGAPAPVTAFMSVGTKAAAMIAFARVFDVVFLNTKVDWVPVVWAITILTIVGGNILALVQTNVKRMLAYSSIAHAGYLLIGVVVGGTVGLSAILFYLLCYTFMNLGAFGVVSILEQTDNSGSSYKDIRGLWYRQPVVAGLLAFFMLALAGFPPMAGFAAKYYLFYAALQGGYPELLIIGVLASVLGMYYYLRVIATMFMEQETIVAPAVVSKPTTPTTPIPAGSRVSTKLGNANAVASSRGATAVAMKPKATATTSQPLKPGTNAGEQRETINIGIMSWIALGIAVLGTFAMGTVLPLWLVNLAQQAAQMMLK